MCYVTETRIRGQQSAELSPSQSTDLHTTEPTHPGMGRAVENFQRMSAEKAAMTENSQIYRPAAAVFGKIAGVTLMLGIGMAFVPADAKARSPIACGTTYTIARGDTLFQIAERAFGNGKLYNKIFEANSDVLPNSASVEIGNAILIPCLDSSGQVLHEDAVALAPKREPDEAAVVQAAATGEPVLAAPISARPASDPDDAPKQPSDAKVAGMTESRTCGVIHTVVRGDTLFKIAERAYGDGWKYKTIQQENRDVLPNSASIELGDQLLIPCLDSAGQVVREDAVALAPRLEPGELAVVQAVAIEEPAEAAPIAASPAPNPDDAPDEPLGAKAAGTNPSPVCGVIHTVTRGDTLFKIANRAHGDGWKYRKVHQDNRYVLPSSDSVELGDPQPLPCLDGLGEVAREDAVAPGPAAEPGTTEGTTVAATMEPAEATPGLLKQAVQMVAMATMPMQSIAGPVNPAANLAGITVDRLETAEPAAPEPLAVIPSIRLLTSSDIAPFAGENLPRGGIITDLVSRSLDAAAPGQQSRVAFVNDWAAHLNYLLPDGAFDVSFPWYKPDCSNPERLATEMQRRCAEFDFSDPIFEVRIGFYTKAGSALAEAGTLAALSGQRLCRPNEHFTSDLDHDGLMAPNVSIETRHTAQECFARLADGEVDVVMLAKSEADEQLRQPGMIGSVAEIAGLETARTLHALVSKKNPDGQAHLERINRGLAELMASGKWFEVVAAHQGGQFALLN